MNAIGTDMLSLEVDKGVSEVIPSKLTALLLQAMTQNTALLKDAAVLDFGCGAGHLSFKALDCLASNVIGIDCDEECIRSFERNIANSVYNRKQFELELVRGLDKLPKHYHGTTDVAICNPAQLVLPSENALEGYTWDGPEGRDMMNHFIEHLDRILSPSGLAFMTNSVFSNPGKSMEMLREQGFHSEVVTTSMIPLYPNMYQKDLLDHLKTLPHLQEADFVEDETGHYSFRAFCLKITRKQFAFTAPVQRTQVGIIAGSGPEAGLDLASKILVASRELAVQGAAPNSKVGDIEAPSFIIDSVPELGISMELPLHYELLWEYMRTTIDRLAPTCKHLVVACNTLHIFSARIEAKLACPPLNGCCTFISYVDCTIDGVLEASLSQGQEVMVLGARAYMATAAELICKNPKLTGGPNVSIPDAGTMDKLDELVHEIKSKGRNDPGIGPLFATVLNKLPSAVSVAILACTELPLISIPEGQLRPGLKLIDATQLVADRLAHLSLPGCKCRRMGLNGAVGPIAA